MKISIDSRRAMHSHIRSADNCRWPLLAACVTVILAAAPSLVNAAFTDETAARVPGITGGSMVGVAWGDYNGDGYVDFIARARLWKNSGPPGYTFSQVANNTGTGIWGDYDNDGDLDVYAHTGNTLNRNESTGSTTSFVQPFTMPNVPSQTAGQGADHLTNRSATWADFNGDGFLDLAVAGSWNGTSWNDTLMINNGGTSFTGSNLGTTAMYSRGIMSCDWDEDGDMDIYVCGYFGGVNRLWRNDGNANFTNVAATTHPNVAIAGHSIGHAWGDFDNDGHFDVFANQFDHGPDPDRRFLKNNGPGLPDFTFTNKGASGIAWVESYASTALGDYDNDGDLDVFITAHLSYGDTSRFYQNNSVGDTWQFDEVTGAEGLTGLGGYQLGWADFDNDGDLDLLTGGKLFVNNLSNANHWIEIILKPTSSSINRSAIGAQVRVLRGDGTILTRQVGSTSGEANQDDLRLHFGLGSHNTPVDIEVTWPDGSPGGLLTTHTKAVDQIVELADAPYLPINCDEVWQQGYGIPSDLSQNCYVDLADVLAIAVDWLRCNDPNTEDCEPFDAPPGPSQPGFFFEDFEGYSVGLDVTAPWESLFGGSGGHPGEVQVDTGTNGTQVLDLVDAAYWGAPIVTLPAADQHSAGSVEWEMASQQDGAYGTARTWFNTDGGTGVGVHDWIVNLSFHSGGDIWERPPGGNLNDMTNPPNIAMGVITGTVWHKYRVDFDFLGGDGSNGEWSLFMDDSPTATLQGALGTDDLAFTRTLKVIGWEVPSGQGFLIDNVSVKQRNTFVISGNVGMQGVTLDGLMGAVVSGPDGFYSGEVIVGWSGTVTATSTQAGIGFSPASKAYTNVSQDYTDQNYWPIASGFLDDFESYTAGGTVTDPPWPRIWSNYSTATAGMARVVLDDGSNGTNAMDLVSAAYWGSAKHTFAVENQFSAGYVQFDYRPNGGGLRQFFRDDTGRNITEIDLNSDGFREREGTSNVPHDPVNETGAILDSSTWYTVRFDFDFDAPGDLGSWALSVDGGVVLTGDIDHNGGVSGHYLADIGWDIAGGSFSSYIDNISVFPHVYAISGNAGIASATMTGLPCSPDCVVSEPDGSYSAQVVSGWTGTVTPTLGSYAFDPPSVAYTNVSQDYTNQDYSVTPFGCNHVWEFGYGMPADLDHDCYINLGDIAVLFNDWLRCNDPNDPTCEELAE